jgi:hypothetical protein
VRDLGLMEDDVEAGVVLHKERGSRILDRGIEPAAIS